MIDGLRGSLAEVAETDLLTPAIPFFLLLMFLEMYVLHRERRIDALEDALRIATHEYVDLWRDVRAEASWRTRALRLWRGPGWQPAAR
jgi:hypothetical protein